MQQAELLVRPLVLALLGAAVLLGCARVLHRVVLWAVHPRVMAKNTAIYVAMYRCCGALPGFVRGDLLDRSVLTTTLPLLPWHWRLVVRFLPPLAVALARFRHRFFPGGSGFVVARCKFGDRLLETQQQQEQRWRQVVVLGAGMDTRAWRFASPSCRFFEVDLPETQSYKRARVPAPQQQREVHFLPVDFESQRFEEELRAHPAFDPDEPTLFFWEGVSYYLRRDTSLGVLRAIRSLCQAPGSAVYLDYLDAGDIEDPQEHHLGIKHMSALLRRLGEPLLCGFAPTKEGLQEELRDCGLRFRVSQHMGPRDIQREFLTDADSGRCSPCAHIFFALLEVD